MRSTGPILAVGGITLVNRVIVHGEPMDWRIPIATALAAGAVGLIEKGWEQGGVGLAWLALVVVLFVRTDPAVPSPIESAEQFWNNSKG
jgi:hypothetical protein